MKAQAAVDFVASYGIALVIILIALAIIYRIGTSNQGLAAPTCTAVPGFSCDYFALNSNGILTLRLSQAIGAPIYINGTSCSSQINATGNKPAFGNIYVTKQTAYYVTHGPYYPIGNVIYSSSYYIFTIPCYGPVGQASGQVGSAFTGYIWLNYTIKNYGTQTQRIASISAPYT